MALDIDSSRPLVSPALKRKLVEVVRDAAANESEPDWLEWKSTVELSEKRWQFEIARFVLGAGNRMPDRAARTVDGHAYMLLGVEPRNLCGVSRIDNAQLEQGVSAYAGHDGPAWSPDYVEVDGADVLVVTIAPPKLGDRIFTLAKEWDVYRNGTVFVRRAGKTEQANSAEMRQLQERLLGVQTRPQLDIDVELADHDFVLTPVDLSDASVEEWISLERGRLARPKPVKRKTDPSDPLGVAAGVADQLAAMQSIIESAASALGRFTKPEDRTPEEYDAQVESYLASARAGIAALAAEKSVASRLNIVRLALRNRTADNYEEVAVSLHLSGDVWAFNNLDEAFDSVRDIEAPPRKWGPRTVDPLRLSVPTIPSVKAIGWSRPTIRNDGSATIEYSSVHLRPEALHRLSAVHILAAANGDELVGEWRATSKSVSGVVRGKVVVPLGAPVTLRELFDRPDHEDDD